MKLYSALRCSFLKVLIALSEIQLLTLISNAYLYHVCPNTTTYEQNSTYQANLHTLLSDLSSNTSTAKFFYNATAGSNAPDIVYGLFLCRGDVTSDVCRECVKTATTEIVERCPKEKQVVTWYDKCILRYDNISFFGTVATSPELSLWNVNNVTDPNRLDQVLGDVLNILLNSQNFGPLRRFAAGESEITNLQRVYSLVQCTPDLSSSNCNRCLRTVIGQLPGGRQGARVLTPSCNVRYETYPFYNDTSAVSNFTLTNNCNHTVWPAIVSNGISQIITTTGFVLEKGESKSFTAPYFWIGSFWGRTYCSENSTGYFSCITGDCGSGKLECSNFSTSATTLTTFSTNRYNRLDYYEISVVNGYNLPMAVSGTNCTSVECSINLNDLCPSELKVTRKSGGDVVACKNSLYMYPEVFTKACPTASIDPYASRTSTCAAGSAYVITFCPSLTDSSSSPSAGGAPGSPSPPDPPGNRRLSLGAIVGVVLVAFAIICLTISFFFMRRKAKKKHKFITDVTGYS